ncbi:major histocompatibility complex class I-related gene protein-like isoform X1 [Melanotaenia boesemani]|uniref:major histocompatibility complex class I-related gene protein-like isoform X1 n=1 Tax=Melanotaenia boesemani TaxID=1250792 RepID=UPI001C045DA9|nr:major histocompatibility complex class I-related gene protein-like isoform X1 [Melanotaenia boesemani]
MKTLLLILLCRMSSSVKYSLTYLASGFSGVPNMPDLMITAEFGQMQVDYCDSNKTRRSYPGFWGKVNQIDPQILKWYNERCFETQPLVYKGVISRLKENNPNEAVHILQTMGGCGWDERTGDVSSFLRHGYDGEDFMEMDMKTLAWIVQNPLAAPIQQMWAANLAAKTNWMQFFTEVCPEWLKKFVSIGPLKEKELPSVSLLQKTPSSPVSCHTTGFYPNTALMFWRKDGEEIHENVEHGEILPNHDWTFQLSVKLNVSSIPPEDWRRYDCVFQLSGLENNITTILDKNMIRTNLVSPSEFPSGAVIGGCVGLLLLLLCITGLFFWKRKNNVSRLYFRVQTYKHLRFIRENFRSKSTKK